MGRLLELFRRIIITVSVRSNYLTLGTIEEGVIVVEIDDPHVELRRLFEDLSKMGNVTIYTPPFFCSCMHDLGLFFP